MSERVELDPDIGAFIEGVEARRSGSTKRIRTAALEDFAAWLADRDVAAVEVTPGDVEDYAVHLGKRDCAASVISGTRWTLGMLFDTLETRGEIEENPVEQVNWSHYAELLNGTKKSDYVEARGGIFALPLEGVETLAEHVPEPTERNTLLVHLMYQTGVRAQELADMKLADIDREERRIEVYSKKLDSEHSRADPWRPVWYGQSIEKYMQRWLDFGGRDGFYTADDSDYLFLTHQSERMSENRVNEIVREAATNAGMQEVMYQDTSGSDRHLITSHTLRHSFAYECMQSNDVGRIDLKTLAELMGHQDTSTTEKYLVFADSDLGESRRLYGPK